MDKEYQIVEIADDQHRVRQSCTNPELGFVVLADFYGPWSREYAERFLKALK